MLFAFLPCGEQRLTRRMRGHEVIVHVVVRGGSQQTEFWIERQEMRWRQYFCMRILRTEIGERAAVQNRFDLAQQRGQLNIGQADSSKGFLKGLFDQANQPLVETTHPRCPFRNEAPMYALGRGVGGDRVVGEDRSPLFVDCGFDQFELRGIVRDDKRRASSTSDETAQAEQKLLCRHIIDQFEMNGSGGEAGIQAHPYLQSRSYWNELLDEKWSEIIQSDIGERGTGGDSFSGQRRHRGCQKWGSIDSFAFPTVMDDLSNFRTAIGKPVVVPNLRQYVRSPSVVELFVVMAND